MKMTSNDSIDYVDLHLLVVIKWK